MPVLLEQSFNSGLIILGHVLEAPLLFGQVFLEVEDLRVEAIDFIVEQVFELLLFDAEEFVEGDDQELPEELEGVCQVVQACSLRPQDRLPDHVRVVFQHCVDVLVRLRVSLSDRRKVVRLDSVHQFLDFVFDCEVLG